MQHPRLARLGLLLLLLAAGCTDRENPTAPAFPGDVLHSLSAATQGSTEGFYFLPPMVSAVDYSGTFDPDLAPIVQICSSPDCESIHATFSMMIGKGSESVRVDVENEHYIVNWHTRRSGAEAGHTYRIRVVIGNDVLGYADVQVVSNGSEATDVTAAGGIAVIDGSTLPIKFRIETDTRTDNPVVSRIEVDPASASIKSGESQQFTATVYDQFNQVMDGESITWLSLDESVATVDAEGLATGLSAGVAMITAVINSIVGSSELTVQVNAIVYTISISPAEANIWEGETQEFTASVYADGVEMTEGVPPLIWSSSDEGVATVTENGIATGVTEGEATITSHLASNLSVSAEARVIVTSPVPGFRLSAVTGGIGHSCGLSVDGRAFCWGSNQYGQLGDGTTTDRHTPVQVAAPSGVEFTSIKAGYYFTAAKGSDGVVWTWGQNIYGQLGDGTATDRHRPVQVVMPNGVTVLSINAGSGHMTALTVDGIAWAWGRNNWNQLGDGTTTNRFAPVQVAMPDGVRFASLSVRSTHNAALTSDGIAWTWGRNYAGQLGDGTTTNRSRPVRVAMPDGMRFSSLEAGGVNTMALDLDGIAWTWGRNQHGQLGDGTTTDRYTPVRVVIPDGVRFSSFADGGGGYHTMALTSDGIAWGWGNNEHGQLGDGTTTERHTPVRVVMPLGSNFYSLAAVGDHTLALTPEGIPWAWGRNQHGQLGDGTTTSRPTPVPVSGGITFDQ